MTFMARAGKPVTPGWVMVMAGRMVKVRGNSFKNDVPTSGWWSSFLSRHPQLSLRTPSIINAGRLAMSRRSTMDNFFSEAKVILTTLGILDDASRLYNIDESWTGSNDEQKKQKVVAVKGIRTPYQWQITTNEHVTLSMCISAEGAFLPTMVTFTKSIPRGNDFIDEGPPHCLYTASESGHIDRSLYFRYIRHLEPHLSSTRPVVIFQDNLMAHEDYDLVEFCVDKQIHLVNFPSKTSHILQPLDKIFGSLKNHIQKKAREASLFSQIGISRSKIPILLRFGINAMKQDVISGSFQKTGLCPLNGAAIGDEVLVGDSVLMLPVDRKTTSGQSLPSCTTTTDSHVSYTDVTSPRLNMQVYDDEGELKETSRKGSCAVQTSPVASLPCRSCLDSDVSLHPLITSQVVDLEFAEAFFGYNQNNTESGVSTLKKTRRDYSKGKWLTAESEMDRRRDERLRNQLDTQRKMNEKSLKEEQREQRKAQEDDKRRLKYEDRVMREAQIQTKKDRDLTIKQMKLDAKKSVLHSTSVRAKSAGKCHMCAGSCIVNDSIKCSLCCQLYHIICVAHPPLDLVLICPICKLM